MVQMWVKVVKWNDGIGRHTVLPKIICNFRFCGVFKLFKRTFNVPRVFYSTKNHTRNGIKLVRSSGFDTKAAKQSENWIFFRNFCNFLRYDPSSKIPISYHIYEKSKPSQGLFLILFRSMYIYFQCKKPFCKVSRTKIECKIFLLQIILQCTVPGT